MPINFNYYSNILQHFDENARKKTLKYYFNVFLNLFLHYVAFSFL